MPLLSSNIAGSASRSPSWGAWIEIATSGMVNGAKAYSRSPSWGAWIEIAEIVTTVAYPVVVAPPRGERGLKSLYGIG